MKTLQNSIRFNQISTKFSAPSIDPLRIEIACTFHTGLGCWYTRITDTPKPSFNIIRMDYETRNPEGPISFFQKSKKGLWRLRLKDGSGLCPSEELTEKEWKYFIEGVNQVLAQISIVRKATTAEGL